METDIADSKNAAIKRQILVELKQQILDMLEVDADQVMWNHVCNAANSANCITDELNGTQTEEV